MSPLQLTKAKTHNMKKLILGLTIAAFASVGSLQAGEGKACATACDSTKVAKASECSKTAKAAECSKATACCASKTAKASVFTKGATLLMAKR